VGRRMWFAVEWLSWTTVQRSEVVGTASMRSDELARLTQDTFEHKRDARRNYRTVMQLFQYAPILTF